MKKILGALVLLGFMFCSSALPAGEFPIGLQLYTGVGTQGLAVNGDHASVDMPTVSAHIGIQLNAWGFALLIDGLDTMQGYGYPTVHVRSNGQDKTFALEYSYWGIRYYPHLGPQWLHWYAGYGYTGLTSRSVDNNSEVNTGVGDDGYPTIDLGSEFTLCRWLGAYVNARGTTASFVTSPSYGDITGNDPWFVSCGLTVTLGKRHY